MNNENVVFEDNGSITTYPEPQIERNLVVGTGHIDPDEIRFLARITDLLITSPYAEEDPVLLRDYLAIHPYTYGWYVYADAEIADWMIRENTCANLARLMKWAHRVGCRYLVLDHEGPVYDGLPYYVR